MKRLPFIFLAAAGLIFSSCEKIEGEGPVRTEIRNVSSFSGIDFRVSGEVNYRQDPNYKVEVSAQQNILDKLETYVANDRLIIKFKDFVRVRNHEDVIVNITAPAQRSLRLSGPGSLKTSGPLTPSDFFAELSGSGNIFIEQLTTGRIEANLSGSGGIKVENGTGTEEKLRISGSGNIDLRNVAATSASAHTSGSGDTWVNVSNSLDVNISGSGNVFYRGNPVINAKISGSGKVQPW